MNIQIRKIGFGIRVTERQMCSILFFLSSQNLCKKNVAIERALCIGFDILFLSADLTVIKDYDILFFILFVGLKYLQSDQPESCAVPSHSSYNYVRLFHRSPFCEF